SSEVLMRGTQDRQASMLALFSIEARIPSDHPLRRIKAMADQELWELSKVFDRMYSNVGRPSVAPEKILKSLLLMALYSVRSERQLCEQMGYNLLFRWFLDMELEEESFDATVFSKNRDRLMEHEVGRLFFDAVVRQAREAKLMSDDHFTVDGTLIEAWASLKSFRPRDCVAINGQGRKRIRSRSKNITAYSNDMLRYVGRKEEAMAYRFGNREQLGLLPASIEDYVSQEDPVRVYDGFVEKLKFTELGIEIDEDQVGNPECDPKAMMKLLVYGYSYGGKGARRLERECHHNLSVMSLVCGLKTAHKRIAEYRRRHKKALAKVLKQCVRVCMELNLIAGNVLFVDGTKIRANAGRGKSHGREWYDNKLKEIDRRIEQLLEESEQIDRQEADQGSSVRIDKELAQAERLKEKITQALRVLQESGREKVNLTDPDCAIMHSAQGSHASYNVQSVVDDQNGLIVHVEAVSDGTDVNQFARQIDGAKEELGKPCEVGCADAGYADSEELKKI